MGAAVSRRAVRLGDDVQVGEKVLQLFEMAAVFERLFLERFFLDRICVTRDPRCGMDAEFCRHSAALNTWQSSSEKSWGRRVEQCLRSGRSQRARNEGCHSHGAGCRARREALSIPVQVARLAIGNISRTVVPKIRRPGIQLRTRLPVERRWRSKESWGERLKPMVLGSLDLDPGSTYGQQIGDQLGNRAFRGTELHGHHTLTESVVKIVEIPGDLASLGKIHRRLQMPNNQNQVPDALGPPSNVVLLDGIGDLPQIFDHLLIGRTTNCTGFAPELPLLGTTAEYSSPLPFHLTNDLSGGWGCVRARVGGRARTGARDRTGRGQRA